MLKSSYRVVDATAQWMTFWGGPDYADERIIQFPGGEPHVQFDRTPPPSVVIEAHLTDGDIMPLLALTDALRRAGSHYIHLYIPYFPGARQDRQERGGALTVKLYADIINAQGYESVIIMDPHSDVTPALVDRVRVFDQTDVFAELRHRLPGPERAVLVAPDQGAVKKAEKTAMRFGYDLFFGKKKRDPKTGRLSGFEVEDIPQDRIPIIVDDICDGGGTFMGLAEAMGDRYPSQRPILVVSHGIFSKPTRPMMDRFQRLVTTDSICTSHYSDDVEIVSITADVIAKYLP